MRKALSSLLALSMSACGGAAAGGPPPTIGPHDEHVEVALPAPTPVAPAPPTDEERLAAAEEQASPGARRVLDAARAMIDEGVVVEGSCWGWANAVYQRAGGTPETVFRGRQQGPYADDTQIQPGDWLYFINHEWGDGTHSAIFIAWVDAAARIGLTVSYAGGHTDAPGRFGTYSLTGVFHILRMGD